MEIYVGNNEKFGTISSFYLCIVEKPTKINKFKIWLIPRVKEILLKWKSTKIIRENNFLIFYEWNTAK